MKSKTVPYRQKTERERPHFFIFSEFPTEKTEKKGLFSQFRATEKLETENLRFFIFGFRTIRNGLIPSPTLYFRLSHNTNYSRSRFHAVLHTTTFVLAFHCYISSSRKTSKCGQPDVPANPSCHQFLPVCELRVVVEVVVLL